VLPELEGSLSVPVCREVFQRGGDGAHFALVRSQ
jgi:hypothetical protein